MPFSIAISSLHSYILLVSLFNEVKNQYTCNNFCFHSAQKSFIKEVINHPLYNEITFDFDVSILKLKTALVFNEKVMAACLPEPSFKAEENGGFGVVSGWGTTTEGEFYNFANLYSWTTSLLQLKI